MYAAATPFIGNNATSPMLVYHAILKILISLVKRTLKFVTVICIY